MTCGSRSTAITSSPRCAKNLACRPDPLATSSTGPRVTSGAQRTTQGEGVSSESCAMISQQLSQNRPVATRLIFAIAADRNVCLSGKRCQQRDEPLRSRCPHLFFVRFPEPAPARIGPRLRQRPADYFLAGRKLRKPDVVVVTARVVALLDAARRPPHRAEAQPLARRAGATEPDDANHRFPPPPCAGWFPRIRS